MRFFDKLAVRIDEALIVERIMALPPERQRTLINRMLGRLK